MGDVSVKYPATFIQEHQDCIVYADTATAEPPVLTP